MTHKEDKIRKRLHQLKLTSMRSDPHSAEDQLNITLALIDIIEDIQRVNSK